MNTERSSSAWSLVARSDVMDDPPEASSLRRTLVRALVSLGDATTPSVIEALRLVPRHLFVPGASMLRAYVNNPISIGFGQTISQPSIVAQMTEALELGGHENVLEVGTGSGYQAAVLSLLVRDVFAIERIQPLAIQAAERLARLGYANVHVIVGDGYAGFSEEAPFDRVIVTAAPPEVPQALLDQLAEGGILVAPIGPPDASRLVRVRKVLGTCTREDLGAVRFVEMLSGVEAAS
jgi:protein-L-isoaspartate(D-aspartate) O-methyltransferase